MCLKRSLFVLNFLVFFSTFSQNSHTSSPPEDLFTRPRIEAPCDLKKISEKKELPSIKIHGEYHSSSESQKLHEDLTLEARSGQCVVGLEGVLCSNSQKILREHLLSVTRKEPLPGDENLFFGIEDEMAFSLAILFKTHSEAKKYQKTSNLNALSSLIVKTKKDINRYPFLREVFNNLKTQVNKKNVEKKSTDILQEFPQDLEALILSMIQTIKSKNAKTPFHVPQELEQIALDYFKSGDDSSIKKTVVLEWRNLLFTENILKFYCQTIQRPKPPKNFEVVVGNAHVPGIEKLLKESIQLNH